MQKEELYPAKAPSKYRQETFHWRGGDEFTDEEKLKDDYRHAYEDFLNAKENLENVEQQIKEANAKLEECTGYSNELQSFLGNPEKSKEERKLKEQLKDLESQCMEKQGELQDMKQNQNSSFAGSLESELAKLLIEIRKRRKTANMQTEKIDDISKQLAALYCTTKYQDIVFKEWKVNYLKEKNSNLKNKVLGCRTPPELESRGLPSRPASRNLKKPVDTMRATLYSRAQSRRQSRAQSQQTRKVEPKKPVQKQVDTLVPLRDEDSNIQRIIMTAGESKKDTSCLDLKIEIKKVERKLEFSKASHRSYLNCMIDLIDKLNESIMKLKGNNDESGEEESINEEESEGKPQLSMDDIIDTEDLRMRYVPSEKKASERSYNSEEDEEEEDPDVVRQREEKERQRAERRMKKEMRKKEIEDKFRKEQKEKRMKAKQQKEKEIKEVLNPEKRAPSQFSTYGTQSRAMPTTTTKANIVKPTQNKNYPRKTAKKVEEPKKQEQEQEFDSEDIDKMADEHIAGQQEEPFKEEEEHGFDSHEELQHESNDFSEEKSEEKDDDFGDEKSQEKDSFETENTEEKKTADEDDFDEKSEEKKEESKTGDSFEADEKSTEKKDDEDEFDEKSEEKNNDDDFGDEKSAEKKEDDDDFDNEKSEEKKENDEDDFDEGKSEEKNEEDDFDNEKSEEKKGDDDDDFDEGKSEEKKGDDDFGEDGEAEKKDDDDDFEEGKSEEKKEDDDFGDDDDF